MNIIKNLFQSPDGAIADYAKLAARAGQDSAKVSKHFVQAGELGKQVESAKLKFFETLSDTDFENWVAVDRESRARVPLLNEMGRLGDHFARRHFCTADGKAIAHRALLAAADKISAKIESIDADYRAKADEHGLPHSSNPAVRQLQDQATKLRECAANVERGLDDHSVTFRALLSELI